MRAKMSVRDLLSCKGRRVLSLSTAFDGETAGACNAAGIDILLTWGRTTNTMEELRVRMKEVVPAAPSCMIGVGMPMLPGYTCETEALRSAYEILCLGGNLIYASGMGIEKFRVLGREKIPCVGHVGLVPFQSTWMGGMRAVGKTADEALEVYRRTLEFQEAGCVAVEMEVVPQQVAQYIASKVDILVFSMGSGAYCDGQFLFSCDILGTNNGHIPRHAVKYRDLYSETVAAMSEYIQDIRDGRFPQSAQSVNIQSHELERFMEAAEKLSV